LRALEERVLLEAEVSDELQHVAETLEDAAVSAAAQEEVQEEFFRRSLRLSKTPGEAAATVAAAVQPDDEEKEEIMLASAQAVHDRVDGDLAAAEKQATQANEAVAKAMDLLDEARAQGKVLGDLERNAAQAGLKARFILPLCSTNASSSPRAR